MAFEDNIFLIAVWIPDTGGGDPTLDVSSTRIERNAERATQLMLDADPNTDVWQIKLQTNRNAGSLKKSKIKPGPRQTVAELAELEADGEVVGDREVQVPIP